jgi:hypothetical protein
MKKVIDGNPNKKKKVEKHGKISDEAPKNMMELVTEIIELGSIGFAMS